MKVKNIQKSVWSFLVTIEVICLSVQAMADMELNKKICRQPECRN